MRSFIIRVYRHGPGGGLSGTVQAVGAAADQAPLAFASAAELLLRLRPSTPQDRRQPLAEPSAASRCTNPGAAADACDKAPPGTLPTRPG